MFDTSLTDMPFKQVAVVGGAAAGGGATFFVVRDSILTGNARVGSPGLIAACVGALGFFGLIQIGPIFLMGWAALAFCCVVYPFVRYLMHHGLFDEPRERDRESSRRRTQPWSEPDEVNIPTSANNQPADSPRSIPPAPEPERESAQPKARHTRASTPVIPLTIRRPAAKPHDDKHKDHR